jgi:hypothetical protein
VGSIPLFLVSLEVHKVLSDTAPIMSRSLKCGEDLA